MSNYIHFLVIRTAKIVIFRSMHHPKSNSPRI